MQDSLNSTEIRTFLPSAFPGKVIITPETASTNTDARLLAEHGVAPYTTVIAETQTAGRGRGNGRSFYSPQGTGIYLSVILPYSEGNLLKITPAVAVAVCRTIETFTEARPGIKWVNDILMDGRKVCGILCEAVPRTAQVIAGIGINFSTSTFPAAIADIAGPVFTDPPVSRNVFIGTLLANLHGMDYDRSIPEYRRRSCVIGTSIRYMEDNIWHPAFVQDIDDNGGLVIVEDGMTKTLVSGEIRLHPQE